MISGNGCNQSIIQAKKLFISLFGDASGSLLEICPASIILLGDHTHYNDGILLSACIDKFWIFLIRKRKDSEINLASAGSDTLTKLSIENPNHPEDGNFRILRGLLALLKEEDLLRTGFDCVITTTVPECVGLGSSAAQQVGFLNAVRNALSLNIDDEKLLTLVRRNELNILGKISNTAHHYTVQFGREKKLFFMDIRTKEHKTISLDTEECSLVICDSGERIIEPQKICAERIEECEVGVKGLRLYLWGIRNLRDIELEFLHKHFHMLPGRIFSRVLYNVKERIRAHEAMKYLRKKMIDELGKLLVESHNNLSGEYDLGNEYSNFLVGESLKIDGVYGSKLISCSPSASTFTLLKSSEVDIFREKMNNAFKEKYNRELKIHVVNLANGVKKITAKEFELRNQ
ncbi:MAG: galactokinase family protein [Melioribacteraceae bacterium]